LRAQNAGLCLRGKLKRPVPPCFRRAVLGRTTESEFAMVEERGVAPPAEARVSTGVSSLDTMLEGGLVARRPYLVVGPSGTGKTTFAIQFLCEGVRRGERVLLVTLEEPPNEARVNHRGLEPLLSRVEVFDAIPDIMRYERAPFKDIASVRYAVPFSQVPVRIRQSPELASVEVTITALEQMLRTEVIRKGYTRVVIDSLTALQYFCMKGFEPVAGAQSFLRFLSDLRVTTILTVESPLEDVESAERSLARGEIRLFRWELDGQTVRAIGVEKFRGSSHDVRLHPYRIGPQGITINLDVTISRDTRQIIEPIVPRIPAPAAAAPVAPLVSPVTPLLDELRDLVLLGADVGPARTEIEAALAAANAGRTDEAQAHLSRVSALVLTIVDRLSHGPRPAAPADPGAAGALQRVVSRADSVRTGVPPTSLPPPPALQVQLAALLSLLPTPAPSTAAPRAAPTGPGAPAVAPIARPAPSRGLAAPPAPRPTVGGPSAPQPPPVAAALGAEKATPPPLPKAPTPSWPSPTASPAPTAPPTPPARLAPPRETAAPAAKPAPPPAARPTPSPAKRRRAPSPAPKRKAAAPAPRATSTHPPVSPPAAAPVAPPAAAPLPTAPPPAPPVEAPPPASGPVAQPTPPAPAPAPAIPPAPTIPVAHTPHAAAAAPSPAKPRRRAPRKRKAPPVVSVEVEEIPADALGTPPERPSGGGSSGESDEGTTRKES